MPTYADYQQAGGKLSEEEYSSFARQAWAYLDTITLGKAALASGPIGEKVAQCCYALTEEMCRESAGGEVVSASNDGYSETYATSGKTSEQRLSAIASVFLAATGLLSRVMGGCCHAGL